MHGDESGMADEACGDQFVFDLDQYFYIIVIYQLECCDRVTYQRKNSEKHMRPPQLIFSYEDSGG